MRPPKYALKFLRWYCKEDYLEEIEGDLIELFEEQCLQSPQMATWVFYWQVFLHFRPDFIRSINNYNFVMQLEMLKSYFKMARRNLAKNSVFSAIHILGLTIGVAACLLIFQYVHFERTYDSFHEHAENIYRVPIKYSEGFSPFPKTAANHPGLGPAMKADFPEVIKYTRMLHPSNIGANLALSFTDETAKRKQFNEEKIYLADSSFFDIFSFPFLKGAKEIALDEPASIVMSASMAQKYFGEKDPVGKVVHLNGPGGRALTVTGVIEDLPKNSHLEFDALLSFHTFFSNISQENLWIWPEFHTYVLLQPEADIGAMEARFPAFTDKYMAEIHKEHNFYTYFSLQPLLDIHLKTDCANEITKPGSERMVYFLTMLGIFILLIAWINYINLSTSKSIERAKEIGVRKVVGATKSQLVGQFLTEASLLNAIGILLGLLLAKACLPLFTELVGKDIGDTLLSGSLLVQPIFWILLIGSVLVGGIVSGIYPALVLSAIKPIGVLRGSFNRSRDGVVFRKVLVGFQFVLSILLIAATLLVSRQLSYMNQEELGYNKDQILVIRAPIVRDSITLAKSGVLLDQLLEHPSVSSIARSSEIPGKLIAFRSEARKDGLALEHNIPTYLQSVDDQFMHTFEVPLMTGRNFVRADSSRIFNADNNKVLVNESLALALGYQQPDEIIGENIRFKLGQPYHKAEVIGVVNNYHQRSLKEAYDPILYYYPSYSNWRYFSLNVHSSDWLTTIAQLKEKYTAVFESNSFEYFFLDEYFDRQYLAEQRFSKVCTVMAGLAIFVACLGFLGLSALILARRTKEIGIRKILGARIAGILLLLSKEFIILLFLANILALPIIIYFGQLWLHNFAFNAGLGWQIFVFPLLLLLFIVGMIVSIQLSTTARTNPVDALRNE